MRPAVSIVLVNWNGWADTMECLESIFRISYPNYSVIVVDNGSHDFSVEHILLWAEGRLTPLASSEWRHSELLFPPVEKPIPVEVHTHGTDKALLDPPGIPQPQGVSPLVILRSSTNLGFTGGSNLGIAYALAHGSEYILLLNNDTVVEQHVLDYLLQEIATCREVGIYGGKVLFYERPDIIQSIGSKIALWRGGNPHIGFNQRDRGQFDGIRRVDYVTGAFMLVHREVFDTIGKFDERFFMYVEDVDLCYRATQAGFLIRAAPRARIWHKTGKSSGTGFSRTFLYYAFRNRVFFLRKHFGVTRIVWIWPVLLRWLRACAGCLKRGDFEGILYAFRGLMHGVIRPL